jgi:hypothetical protein
MQKNKDDLAQSAEISQPKHPFVPNSIHGDVVKI